MIEDMSKTRKSLATTKGKDTSRRAKPLVAGAYFQNIKDGSQIELAEGESISWKVRLRVYKK